MKNLKINKEFFNEKKNLVLNKTKKVLAGVLVITALAVPISSKACTNYVEFTSSDTLWAISSHYYGDGNYWKYLAAYNNIDNPRAVRNGTIIAIPELNILLNWCYGEDPNYFNEQNNNINTIIDTYNDVLSDKDIDFLEENFLINSFLLLIFLLQLKQYYE